MVMVKKITKFVSLIASAILAVFAILDVIAELNARKH